jgi:hypothetical protein
MFFAETSYVRVHPKTKKVARNRTANERDERRFIVPGLYLNRRRIGLLPAQEVGLRQWRHLKRRGRIWI